MSGYILAEDGTEISVVVAGSPGPAGAVANELLKTANVINAALQNIESNTGVDSALQIATENVAVSADVIDPFKVSGSYAGIMVNELENTSSAAAAVVGSIYKLTNDNGYWGATWITNSGSTILGGALAYTYQNYNQGYGDFLFTNDGNVDFRWFSDPADNHNFTALSNEIMTLTAAGDLSVASDISSDNIKRGAGTPEGVVAGKVGDMFTRTDGGVGTTLYVKESGTGNTGWAAK